MAINELELNADLRRAFQEHAIWRPIIGFARPYAPKLLLLLVAHGVSLGFSLVQPFLIRLLIDGVLRESVAGSRFSSLASSTGMSLSAVSLLILVLGMLNVASSIVASRYQARVDQDMLMDLQSRVFDTTQRMPYGFFIHAKPGAVTNRVTSEVYQAVGMLTAVVVSVFLGIATIVLGVAMMSALDWRLAVVVVFLCLFLIPSRWIRNQVAVRAVNQVVSQTRYTAVIQERLSLSGALLTRLFGLQEENLREFTRHARDYRRQGIAIAWLSAMGQGLINIGTVIAIAAIGYVGGRAILSGEVSVGTLTLLLFYVRLMAAPVLTYSGVRYSLIRGLVAFGRVFEVLDYPKYIQFPSERNGAPIAVPASLEFKDVTFKYPASRELAPSSLTLAEVDPEAVGEEPEVVLRDVSFRVAPGSFVALVGSSGAGKSTIASLACRLFEPTEGHILVDGIPLGDLPEPELVHTVGLVTQDTYLFHNTIRANLLIAKPDATDKEVVKACVAAGIHKFIRSLPGGYETMVGERGVRLSGGQRQRLAFARILLLDPSIIVLDEATAHLDAEAESLLREAVESVLSDRTRVVIAHRLSTVVDADEILVLDHGRIVERGTHQELVELGGRYCDLYQTQLVGALGRDATAAQVRDLANDLEQSEPALEPAPLGVATPTPGPSYFTVQRPDV